MPVAATRLSASKIDEFLTAGKTIWIRNQAGAKLLLQFRGPGGVEEAPKIVPPTKEPFCVSDHVPPSMIRESPVLRRLISEGHIDLLDPDSAEVQKAGPSRAARSLVGSADQEPDEQAVADLDPEDELVEAAPNIAYWCDSVVNGDMKTGEFMTKIEGVRDNLTEADLTHVISTLKAEPRIIDFATEALAELREAMSPNAPGTDAEDDELPVSTGTDQEVQEAAEELLARSAPEGVRSGSSKVRSNTPTTKEAKQQRQAARERVQERTPQAKPTA